MERVQSAAEPQTVKDEPLIKNIKVEKTGTDKYRLLIQLEEKVPYRIYSETGRTIIELNRLKKTVSGYVLVDLPAHNITAFIKVFVVSCFLKV